MQFSNMFQNMIIRENLKITRYRSEVIFPIILKNNAVGMS